MYFRYRFPIFDSWSKQSGDAGDNTIVPESQLDAESNESETGTTDDNLTSFSPGARNRNLHIAKLSLLYGFLADCLVLGPFCAPPIGVNPLGMIVLKYT
jgi:hypothetical protein